MSATEPARVETPAPARGAVPTWLAAFTRQAEGRGPSLQLLDHGGLAPSIATGDSCSVIFDGHLYNPDELGDPSARPRSLETGNAELVLNAYRRLGRSFLEVIRGAFALVILDERNGTLLCARDQLGIYPLFYAETPEEFLISTSPDALLAHPRVAATPNRAMLAERLCFRWPNREETYLVGINRVLPGFALELGINQRRLYRYWDPAMDLSRIDWIGEAELERFDELFERAVSRCLNVGRTGIFLSGGLDSVSVAAFAADASRRRGLPDVQALSLVFPHPDVNEENVQRGVASALGLPQVLLPFEQAAGQGGVLPTALQICREWPMPPISYWLPAYQELARQAAHRGCEVVLTGAGGDEWLTVTPAYAADLLLSLNLAGLYRLARSHRRSYRMSRLQVARNLLWGFGTKPILKKAAVGALGAVSPSGLTWLRRHQLERRSPSWIAPDPELRAEITEREVRIPPSNPFRHGGFYIDAGRTGLDHHLQTAELEESFEIGRRSGILMLHPFLDPDVVDFLYRTPPDFLNRVDRAKGLVRDTLARRFPGFGFEKQKKVHATAYARSVVGGHALEAWRQLGGVPALAELGVVDQREFERQHKGVFEQTDLRNSWQVWAILSLEVWVRPRL